MLKTRPFLVYKSSAGSGKTFTLSKIYLSIALKSSDPMAFRRILAITFTVKAATEMKDRIVSYLSSISGNSGTERKDTPFMLNELVAETGLSELEIKQRSQSILNGILHNYSDLSILTIDKFITRLVKSFSSDLSLSPDFEIEIDHSLFIDQVIDLLYEKIGSENDLTDLVIQFLRFRLNDENSPNLSEAIRETAFSLLSEEFYFIKDRFREFSPNEIFELKNSIEKELKELESLITTQANEALDLIHSSGLNESDFAYGNRGVYSFFQKISNGQVELSVNPGSNALKAIEENKWQSASKNPTVLNISDRLHEFGTRLLAFEKEVKRINLLKAVRKEIYRLGFIGELNKLIEQVKEDENIRLLSDFNRIIAEQFLKEQTPFIYERLGNQYQNILIDEFQDTSYLQWQNLIPLVENSLSEANVSLIVGDSKQSIYRFRGSEPQQFIDLPRINHRATNLFESSHEAHALKSNFRSAQNIVRFNNKFFEQFSQSALSSELLSTYDDLQQEAMASKSGEVSWWFTSADSKSNKEDAMQMMIDRTLDLVSKHGVNHGDICCLFRANADAANFASSILKHGLKVISEESLLLIHNPGVMLLIATFRASKHPKDTFHLQKWLSSYHHVNRLNDYHELAIRLKNEKWSFFELLKQLNIAVSQDQLFQGEMFSKSYRLIELFKLNIEDPFLLKFLDFCSDYETSASYLKSSFLDYWEKFSPALSIQLPDGNNAIRVMSIHKSKGLEFPVVLVFLPEIQKKKNTRDEIWVDLSNELGIPEIALKTADLKGTDLESIHDRENDKSSLDFMNMLYVAFTRAQLQLEIFSKNNPSKNNPILFIQSWEEWLEKENRLHLN